LIFVLPPIPAPPHLQLHVALTALSFSLAVVVLQLSEKRLQYASTPRSANFKDIKSNIASAGAVPEARAICLISSQVSRFVSLRRPQALANCHITHILSVIDWHFDDNSRLIKGYKHLHIPVDDVDDENLITWFAKSNRFIDDGLNPIRRADKDIAVESRQGTPDHDGGRSGVLVHW
jgi:hypothetical protein